MKFDFEISPEGGIIIFYGALEDSDCEELNRILSNVLNQCDNLLISLQGAPSVSKNCMEIIRSTYCDLSDTKHVSFIEDWDC
jgi:hypothetical protein